MAFKLYDLTQQYQELLNIMTEYDEEHEGFRDTLEAIEDALEDKLNATAIIVKTLDAQAKALKEEEARLAKRRKALENNAARLKDYAQDALERTGKVKVVGQQFTLRLQNNPPSVRFLDEKAIPAHYLVEQMPTIDKKAILADLKNNIAVEGAELQQARSLRIV